MLPDLDTSRIDKHLNLKIAVVFAIFLSACSATLQPPQSIIVEALKLQINITQSTIARTLELEPTRDPEVSRIRLMDQEQIQLGQSKAVRLTGRFDWRLPGDQVYVDSLFEIFLQKGPKGQSWRLARPVGSAGSLGQEWITYPLGLDDLA